MSPESWEWRACCEESIAKLSHVLEERPERLHHEITDAVRSVVALRDGFIACRRKGDLSAADQARLVKVNAALSFTVGAEFPLVGVRWQRIAKARDTLRDMLGA
jgi:hypothetical protein